MNRLHIDILLSIPGYRKQMLAKDLQFSVYAYITMKLSFVFPLIQKHNRGKISDIMMRNCVDTVLYIAQK